jgi:hypothetical protein
MTDYNRSFRQKDIHQDASTRLGCCQHKKETMQDVIPGLALVGENDRDTINFVLSSPLELERIRHTDQFERTLQRLMGFLQNVADEELRLYHPAPGTRNRFLRNDEIGFEFLHER